MLFNSYVFLFLFLPVTLCGFYLIRRFNDGVYAKIWLIGMSLWFYGYFNPRYLILILGSISINYCLYRLLKLEKVRKAILITGIILNVAILFYYKYFMFFVDTINSIFKTDYVLGKIILPLGISFFTFQQISFLIDAYHEEMEHFSFFDYCLFVTFFPQLIAGPIVNHNEMFPQFCRIGSQKFDSDEFAKGIYLFVIGLSKKILIADMFGKSVNWGYQYYTVLSCNNAWLLIIFYSFQLYFDFSGYCDMARGLAKLFGFDLPVNFNSPYKAADITEFWRTWHMTLTRFLTKYIYFPLGGNRKGKARQYLNIFLVFCISGVWHGSSWNYFLWGSIHGILQVFSRLARPITKKIPRCIMVAFTFIIVSLALVVFRAETPAKALSILTTAFSGKMAPFSLEMASMFNQPEYWYIVRFLRLARFPIMQYAVMVVFTLITFGIVFFAKNSTQMAEQFQPKVWNCILTTFLAIWCIVSLSGVSTFLYFNF